MDRMTDREIDEAVDILSAARVACARIEGLPAHLAPRDLGTAYDIQDGLTEKFGGRSGFKVTKTTADLAPVEGMVSAPLPAQAVLQSPACVKLPSSGLMVVEGEIGYRLIRDLDFRQTPYSDTEILEAVEAFPAIEILWCRFNDISKIDGYSKIADLIFAGAYITGAPIPDWRTMLPEVLPVRLTLGERIVFQSDAAPHPVGHPYAPLIWLANEGAQRCGGLKQGEVIATGSYTGATPIAPPDLIHLSFPGYGEVHAELCTGP